MKILVVDDDENSRIFLERALRSQGFEIDSAPNGVIALEKAQASPPEMIISDILMPEMNGFEFCHRVKTDPRLHTIPFIFYTATFVEQQDEQLALSLGASRFLVKPMEPESFFQVLHEVINEYHEQRLAVPEAPLVEEPVLEHQQAEALARKLDKKVRELQAALVRAQVSEEQLQVALEAGRMGVWVWEYDSGEMTWSTGIARIFDIRMEDFDGRFTTFLTLVHPGDRQELLRLLEGARTGHQHFTYEFRIHWPDDSVHWVAGHGAFEYDREDTPLCMRGVLMDVTERKRNEENIKRERAFLASAIDLLPFPILFITPENDVIRQNLASLALQHAPNVQLVGDIQLLDPQTHMPLPRQDWPATRALRGEVIPSAEWILRQSDGHEMPVLLQTAPIIIDGELAAAVVAFQDITALKETDYAKNQFLMVLSHEIKTPLTNIIGWAQLAQSAPDTVPEALKTILRNADKQKELLERLLILSRILTGKLALSRKQVNLWQLALLAAGGFHQTAEEHGITMTLISPTADLHVDADTRMLSQAMCEVIENAVDYTLSGGTITLQARRQNHTAVFVVTDTGQGIAAEQLPTLLQPFTQIQRKEEIGGIGIGLAIVRGIIEAHEGRVEITSAGLGHGTSVTIELPMATSETIP